jgi:hypothetical protein
VDILIIILLFVVLLAAMFFVPGWLLRRAVGQVIRIFRHHNATEASTAMSSGELGLQPRPFLRRLMHTRDYKPYALTVMLKAGIVHPREGAQIGKLALFQKLSQSSLAIPSPERTLPGRG